MWRPHRRNHNAVIAKAKSDLDTNWVELVQARNDYEMAYRAVAHSAFATCEQSAIDLKHACGPYLLTQNVATRLIALGFRPAAGHIGPEWAGWLTGQIGHHVPCGHGCRRVSTG